MRPFILLACLIVTACANNGKKDYDASARCYERGYKAGTDAYDQCVKDERASRMLEEQRQEFDRMRQDQEDWKQRRF